MYTLLFVLYTVYCILYTVYTVLFVHALYPVYSVKLTMYVRQFTLFTVWRVYCRIQRRLVQPTVFLAAIADVGLLLAFHHLARYHGALPRIEILY